MRTVASMAFVSAIAASGASAQTTASTAPPPVQFSIGGAGSFPTGDFAENIGASGGVSMHVGLGVGESPITFGTDVTYLVYGSEARKVPLSFEIPDALITVNTDNQIVLLHAVARAQPNRGRWRPYADVVFGFNYIFTQTSVDVEGNNPTETIANTTNFSDFALSYGGGAGVMVLFRSGSWSPRLDMSLRYLAGGEADYLRKGGIRRENGQAFLTVSHSRTDTVVFYAGMAIGR